MPKDRLDFDSFDSGGTNPQELLRDIEEATKRVKQRSVADAVRDKKAAEAPKNKAIMTTIIVVAAIVLFAVAYMVMFRGSGATPQSTTPKDGFVPMTGKTQPSTGTVPIKPTYTPRQTAPVAPRQVAPAAPPSEPRRSNGSESYDDSQSDGM